MEELEKVEYPEMESNEYRMEIQKVIDCIDDNRLLRYLYIFISEKAKRVPKWHPYIFCISAFSITRKLPIVLSDKW